MPGLLEGVPDEGAAVGVGRQERKVDAAVRDLLAADVPPPIDDFDDAAPALSDEDALAFDDDSDDAAAPPAPFERFSLTFVKGPLGIKLETSERPRVEAVTNDSEHHASLRRGDEVVGIGSTSFFESDDDVARGGDGVFSTDDCYELLVDAVEREAFPLTIHFRRRREADDDVFVDAAPCDDALPVAAEDDDYFWIDIFAVAQNQTTGIEKKKKKEVCPRKVFPTGGEGSKSQ